MILTALNDFTGEYKTGQYRPRLPGCLLAAKTILAREFDASNNDSKEWVEVASYAPRTTVRDGLG